MQKTFALLAVTTMMLAAIVGMARYAFAARSTAQLTTPANHSTISGTIELQGTPAGPDFHYYKVEFAFPGSGAWVLVGNTIHYEPVTNGALAALDTTKIPDGVWYGLNNVGATNYINSTSIASLVGECEMDK